MRLRSAVFLLILSLISCDKEDPTLVDPPMTVSMEVGSTITGDDYTASIRRQEVRPLYDALNPTAEQWWRNADGSVGLRKKVVCTIQKPNDRETRFELSLESVEYSPERLRLSAETSSSTGNAWAYLDPRDEAERFFWSLTRSQFYLNNHMVFGPEDRETSLRVQSVRRAIVGGDTTSYVTIHFSGELRGAYDPGGEFGTYTVRDGVFRGVME